uniref:Toxin-antitoxin system HicB family antitoxin n=1 Tax=uncultured prokaryote TaxID=198431 RepID=A0A0H5Q1G7_9ZZZZ|nr:hypothetical protein [uncultured prokaryote]
MAKELKAMNNKKKHPARPHPESAQPETPTGVFSLRLPVLLRAAACKYADATGVSLNGLVCIALADYLASRGHQVK